MNTLKYKLAILLTAVSLSFSATALTFEETQVWANQGFADAQFNLGLMYKKGEFVKQDYIKAIEWYTKAANQGDATAQFNLGSMYVNGDGVRQNYTTAKEWFGKACDDGYQRGCDEYKILNTKEL